jgi:hypothetical protein
VDIVARLIYSHMHAGGSLAEALRGLRRSCSRRFLSWYFLYWWAQASLRLLVCSRSKSRARFIIPDSDVTATGVDRG